MSMLKMALPSVVWLARDVRMKHPDLGPWFA